jgi:hypothetical protein
VEDLTALVLGMRQQFLQLRDILPCFGQVERSKILVEVVVGEVLHSGGSTLSMLK